MNTQKVIDKLKDELFMLTRFREPSTDLEKDYINQHKDAIRILENKFVESQELLFHFLNWLYDGNPDFDIKLQISNYLAGRENILNKKQEYYIQRGKEQLKKTKEE